MWQRSQGPGPIESNAHSKSDVNLKTEGNKIAGREHKALGGVARRGAAIRQSTNIYLRVCSFEEEILEF